MRRRYYSDSDNLDALASAVDPELGSQSRRHRPLGCHSFAEIHYPQYSDLQLSAAGVAKTQGLKIGLPGYLCRADNLPLGT